MPFVALERPFAVEQTGIRLARRVTPEPGKDCGASAAK
jgi:hypothetical protein